jgi:CheY-like chemotaxis protein
MKIIVIDDDPIARMLLTRFITISGYSGTILVAENGQIGFDMIVSNPGDYVIILDYHMPVLDGSGLLKKLDENHLSYPVFLLSSSDKDQLEQEYQTYPWLHGYFDKPIDINKTKIILDFAQAQGFHS